MAKVKYVVKEYNPSENQQGVHCIKQTRTIEELTYGNDTTAGGNG